MVAFRSVINISVPLCEAVYKWVSRMGPPKIVLSRIISKMYWDGSVGGTSEEHILILAERLRNANKRQH